MLSLFHGTTGTPVVGSPSQTRRHRSTCNLNDIVLNSSLSPLHSAHNYTLCNSFTNVPGKPTKTEGYLHHDERHSILFLNYYVNGRAPYTQAELRDWLWQPSRDLVSCERASALTHARLVVRR